MEYAMIFPGQATEIIDPRESLSSCWLAEEIFETGQEIFGEVYNRPKEELAKTLWQQPAVALHSLAVAYTLVSKKFEAPKVVAGHSLGALTSLIYTLVLPDVIGLKVLQRRAEITQKWADKKPGKMAAVIGLCYEDVRMSCQEVYKPGKVVVAANYNEPRQTVISGEERAVDEAIAYLQKVYGPKKIIILRTKVAFHSPLLKEASEEFDRVLLGERFNHSINRIKVIVDDNIMWQGPEIQAYMLGHMVRPVFWAHSVMNILELGIRNFLVAGPGQKMVRMIQRTAEFAKFNDVKITCLSTGEEIEKFLENHFAG